MSHATPSTAAVDASWSATTFEHRIRPRRSIEILRPRELWQYRDLLLILVMRDIKIRYKQSMLGISWAVIQPLTMMLVMTLFFGRLMDMEDYVGKVPYPIFVYAGLLPWTLFASGLTSVSNAMIANAGMIRKVYFPRLLLPLSAVGAPMVDYMIASVLLAMMMVYYQCHMSWELLALPLFVATTLIAVFGVGLLLASLSVSYRDVRQLVPFVVQVGMLSTPVIWPVTIVGERFRIFLPLNPMCGTIGAFRAVVLNQPVPWGDWAISATVGVALLLAALWHFSRFERGYADVV